MSIELIILTIEELQQVLSQWKSCMYQINS